MLTLPDLLETMFLQLRVSDVLKAASSPSQSAHIWETCVTKNLEHISVSEGYWQQLCTPTASFPSVWTLPRKKIFWYFFLVDFRITRGFTSNIYRSSRWIVDIDKSLAHGFKATRKQCPGQHVRWPLRTVACRLGTIMNAHIFSQHVVWCGPKNILTIRALYMNHYFIYNDSLLYLCQSDEPYAPVFQSRHAKIKVV